MASASHSKIKHCGCASVHRRCTLGSLVLQDEEETLSGFKQAKEAPLNATCIATSIDRLIYHVAS
jgi:hypothetical protein